MSSNRHSRNPQQLRSLIENMGRSIDEARNRRLGPVTPPPSGFAPAQNMVRANDGRSSELRYPPQSTNQSSSASLRTDSSTSAPGSNGQHHAPPPVRAANEMFDGGTPRLKARPKRAS